MPMEFAASAGASFVVHSGAVPASLDPARKGTDRMTKHAPDWWLSAWDEYGESLDTNRIVQITVGILAPESDSKVAVSVAGETPITLTHQAVARLQESMTWAVEEHREVLLRADERSDTGNSETAVLDQAQWRSVVAALQNSPESHPEALDALMMSAPPAWRHNTKDDK